MRIPAREARLDEDSMWAALRRRMGAGRPVGVVSPLDGRQSGGAGGSGGRGVRSALDEERPENGPGGPFAGAEAGRAGRGRVGGGPPRRTGRPNGAGAGGDVGWMKAYQMRRWAFAHLKLAQPP